DGSRCRRFEGLGGGRCTENERIVDGYGHSQPWRSNRDEADEVAGSDRRAELSDRGADAGGGSPAAADQEPGFVVRKQTHVTAQVRAVEKDRTSDRVLVELHGAAARLRRSIGVVPARVGARRRRLGHLQPRSGGACRDRGSERRERCCQKRSPGRLAPKNEPQSFLHPPPAFLTGAALRPTHTSPASES